MIIGISGKIGSGKDTVGDIINKLVEGKDYVGGVRWVQQRPYNNDLFERKKFADKLKDIVCLLLGCTREQLEDRDFKEKELGEEWWYWFADFGKNKMLTLEEYENLTENQKSYYCLVKLTPRKLLQLLGTECGRNIIHPNIWVNALMSAYKANVITNVGIEYNPQKPNRRFPNWIITDMRFPNELDAVKHKNGITIRINRPETDHLAGEHLSETALDNSEFNHIITNDGTLEELIEKVRLILLQEGII